MNHSAAIPEQERRQFPDVLSGRHEGVVSLRGYEEAARHITKVSVRPVPSCARAEFPSIVD